MPANSHSGGNRRAQGGCLGGFRKADVFPGYIRKNLAPQIVRRASPDSYESMDLPADDLFNRMDRQPLFKGYTFEYGAIHMPALMRCGQTYKRSACVHIPVGVHRTA